MNQTEPSVVQSREISLVRRVARGEEAAMAELYQTYFEAVLRFVYRRLGESFEDAEEVTQDVFISAVSLAGTYQGLGPVFRWLCGIAQNRIVDMSRDDCSLLLRYLFLERH